MNDTPEVVAEELSAELQTLEQPAEQEQPAEPVAEKSAEQPKTKKQKKARKPRPVAVRILCGFVAFILCIAMFAISLTGVLILNVRTIVSRDGITQIITQLISGQTVSGPVRPALAVGAGVYMDEYTTTGGDLSGSFVDWIYGIIMEEFGEELILTKEQVQTFVEESTVKDFVADKVAGLVEDFYSGESKTVITGEEIKELIQENKEILEEQFNLVINQEALDIVDAALEESGVLKPMEEQGQGLLEYIQQSLAGGVKPDIPDGEDGIVGGGVTDGGIGGGTDNTVGEANPMETVTMIMEIVRAATSYEAVMVLAGAFVLLMLLLFLVTGFSFPATLADTGVVLLLVGLIFGAPAAICLNAPDLVNTLLPQPIGGVVSLIFSTTAGLNFTVLGVGVGLIVLAIVLKIILSVVQKKRA